MTPVQCTSGAIIADSLDNIRGLADRYVYPYQTMVQAHRLIASVEHAVTAQHWTGATEGLRMLRVIFGGVPQASVRESVFLDLESAMQAVDELGVLDAMYPDNVVRLPVRLRIVAGAQVVS